MPCFLNSVVGPGSIVHTIARPFRYLTQQECEDNGDQNGFGACCNGVTCRQATPRDCVGNDDSFIGQGVPCEPNPCNPLP